MNISHYLLTAVSVDSWTNFFFSWASQQNSSSILLIKICRAAERREAAFGLVSWSLLL